MRILIEACVASTRSARAAIEGGADRLELNRDLHRDGLTPGEDLFRDVRRVASIPIIVMIRPHDRGYVYEARTLDRMCEAMRRFDELGADGFAAGALGPDGVVDREALARLCDAAGARELVFHRAFDVVVGQGAALDALIDAGVSRVLTSGGRPTAEAGAGRIADLVARAARRIEILPGAGVGADNAARIVAATCCTQIHGTFRDPAAPDAGTSEERVRLVRRCVDALDPATFRSRLPDPTAGILPSE